MSFSLEVTENAKRDFSQLYGYIAERATKGAQAWANAFDAKLQALTTLPLAYPLAPENDDHSVEIRHVVFNTQNGLRYRALYTVRDTTVFILHLRGPGQDLIGSTELKLPN